MNNSLIQKLCSRIEKLTSTDSITAISYSSLIDDETGLKEMLVEDIEDGGYSIDSISDYELKEFIGDVFWRSKH